MGTFYVMLLGTSECEVDDAQREKNVWGAVIGCPAVRDVGGQEMDFADSIASLGSLYRLILL